MVVENLLNCQFSAIKPNEKWVIDITYLLYGTTMLYLSTIIDLYNNEIVDTHSGKIKLPIPY